MVRGDEAYELTGIPASHGAVFQEVATATGCMISSRAVGKYATGLILDGYASKGFHNKAKSCNWGPMAGFVLADPRFTKAPELSGQAKSLSDAEHYGAKEVPVFITEARRRWLLQNNCMQESARTANTHYYFAASPQGDMMLFVLQRATNVVGSNGAEMWSVHYARAEGRMSFHDIGKTEKANPTEGYLPVMAMRDPLCTVPIKDFRSATTGDYDLFAVFVRSSKYSPDSLDKRMVGHKDLEANIKGKRPTGEDEHLGNITPRIKMLRRELNWGIQRAGYPSGNMVHHSDEGGRPFVNDVDLPVFAVVPGQVSAYGIESVEDLREFISVTLQGYAPVFNPGWMKQMVLHSNAKVASAIHQELLKKIKPA